MRIEWDENKAILNEMKHGVDFADAVIVLEDPLAITISEFASGEIRYISTGKDGLGRLLVVVHTIRENRIRLISARKANRFERHEYEEHP